MTATQYHYMAISASHTDCQNLLLHYIQNASQCHLKPTYNDKVWFKVRRFIPVFHRYPFSDTLKAISCCNGGWTGFGELYQYPRLGIMLRPYIVELEHESSSQLTENLAVEESAKHIMWELQWRQKPQSQGFVHVINIVQVISLHAVEVNRRGNFINEQKYMQSLFIGETLTQLPSDNDMLQTDESCTKFLDDDGIQLQEHIKDDIRLFPHQMQTIGWMRHIESMSPNNMFAAPIVMGLVNMPWDAMWMVAPEDMEAWIIEAESRYGSNQLHDLPTVVTEMQGVSIPKKSGKRSRAETNDYDVKIKWSFAQGYRSKYWFDTLQEVHTAIVKCSQGPSPLKDDNESYTEIEFRGGCIRSKVGSGKTAIVLTVSSLSTEAEIEKVKNEVIPTLDWGYVRRFSKATMFVIPSQLVDQYEGEIQKFMQRSLRVVKVCTIRDFIRNTIDDYENADIVLVTYQFLFGASYAEVTRSCSRNFDMADHIRRQCGHGSACTYTRRERLRKIYEDLEQNGWKPYEQRGACVKGGSCMINIPLECFHWYRIVFDEISMPLMEQKVNAEKLTVLQSRHRWMMCGSQGIGMSPIFDRGFTDYHTPKFWSSGPWHLKMHALSRCNERPVLPPIQHEVVPVQLTFEERIIYNVKRDIALAAANGYHQNIAYREEMLRLCNYFQSLGDLPSRAEADDDNLGFHTMSVHDVLKRMCKTQQARLTKLQEGIIHTVNKYLKSTDKIVAARKHDAILQYEDERIDARNRMVEIHREIETLTSSCAFLRQAMRVMIRVAKSKNVEPSEDFTLLAHNVQQMVHLSKKEQKAVDEMMGRTPMPDIHTLRNRNKEDVVDEGDSGEEDSYTSPVEDDMNKSKDESDECPVCMCEFEDSIVLFACNHFVCSECYQGVLKAQNKPCCPLCRGQIGKSDMIVDFSVKTDPRASSSTDVVGEEKMEGNEQKAEFLGSKIERLIEVIRTRIPEEDKVLVFIQWNDLKEIAARKLREKGMGCVTVRGNIYMRRNQIRQFQNDPNVRILLTSASDLAFGTNLTIANHVAFMHTLFDVANETDVMEQAIGRIYRVGQKKQVKIWQFYTVGTIEETVHIPISQICERFKNMLATDDDMPVVPALPQSTSSSNTRVSLTSAMDMAEDIYARPFNQNDQHVIVIDPPPPLQANEVQYYISSEEEEEDSDDDVDLIVEDDDHSISAEVPVWARRLLN